MQDDMYADMAAIECGHWWYRARRKILAATIADLRLPDKAEILEAGCGHGGNLPMLAKCGAVSAIEPYAKARLNAKKLKIGTVREGGLPGALPFDTQFDLIGAFDVLEHITEDVDALKSLRGALKADGYLLLTVPAYQWLWSEHDVKSHPKRRYTRSRLIAVVKAAGFKVERASYFNTFLFPLIAGVRLTQKLMGKKEGDGETVPASWLNKVFEAIFSSERLLLKYINIPFGVSIVLRAKAA